MADFAVLAHFRVLPQSEANAEGFIGGYAWLLGRYESEGQFRAEVARCLEEFGYVVVEMDAVVVVSSPSDLNDELAPLFGELDRHPLQYKSFHMYRHDDA